MGLNLSMIAVPIEMDNIFSKAIEKSESEYPSIIFYLPKAFQVDFCDFKHPDWIAFKKDAQSLLEYYPNKEFDNKYNFESNKIYDILNYLIGKHINDSSICFFNDGIEFKQRLNRLGQTLVYWDQETLKKKAKLIGEIKYNDLIKQYDFEQMSKLGIYKLHQVDFNKEAIKTVFQNLKSFMDEAIKINGYVLITRH